MTCSTSAVAVCCSNASRVSVISRAFSIAITACAAKFSNSAICFFGERAYLAASRCNHPRETHRLCRSGTDSTVRTAINLRGRLERDLIDLRRIGDLRETLTLKQGPSRRRVARSIALPQSFGEPVRCPVDRDRAHMLAVIELKSGMVDAANALRLVEDRIEHRREVAGRGIDDLQHLGGRGLLLQGFARLGDEPRVLHRDDRLSGEVLQAGRSAFR